MDEGAVQLTVACPLDAVAVTAVGASGEVTHVLPPIMQLLIAPVPAVVKPSVIVSPGYNTCAKLGATTVTNVPDASGVLVATPFQRSTSVVPRGSWKENDHGFVADPTLRSEGFEIVKLEL